LKEIVMRWSPPALSWLVPLTLSLVALPQLATAASTLSSASYQLHGGTLAAAAGASSNALGTVSSSGVHLGGAAAGASTAPGSGTQLMGGLVGSPAPIPEPGAGLLWLAGFVGLLALARRRTARARSSLPCLPYLAAMLATALLVPSAADAVPHDTAYQGRLTDNLGDPLAGPVDIDFAIYESVVELPGEVALYSEEHTAVELDSDGAFNVLIGTGVVIVGSYDPALFQGTNRFLQVTIDGEILEPRQPISSVPFALVAEQIDGAPNLVTQVQAIDNQVGDLPPGGTTIATHIENLEAAVAAAEAAADTAESAADAVATDLAVSDAVQAALIESMGPAPYASALLRAGAFESLQAAQGSSGPLVAATTTSANDWNKLFLIRCLDDHCHSSSQVEVAYGDFNPFGVCIDFNMDGSCALYGPVFYDLTDMSMAVGSDGMPIMVFQHLWAGSSLVFLKCGNEDCNAGTSDIWNNMNPWSGNTTSLIGGIGDLTDSVLGVGSDGFPVIASFSGTDLVVTHCQDLTCSTSSQVTVASLLGFSPELSMKIGANGYPAIAYYNSTNNDLEFIQCTNATCASNSMQVLDSTGTVGRAPSLAINSLGRPVIAYEDPTNDTLKFIRCLDASCSSTAAATVVLPGPVFIDSTDVAFTNAGDAVISYIQSSTLSYLSCLDDDCTTSETTVIGASPPNPGSGRRMDMLVSSSDELISSYIDNSGVQLYARTGSCKDEIMAQIAAAQADATAAQSAADAAQAAADAIVGTCGTLVPALVCPIGPADGPRCNTIPVGAFCESDAECGTNPLLDNCGTFDWYFRTGN